MRSATRVTLGGFVLGLAMVGAVASVPARPMDDAITLRPVKYAELAKIIRGLKGKVVLVDFWADY